MLAGGGRGSSEGYYRRGLQSQNSLGFASPYQGRVRIVGVNATGVIDTPDRESGETGEEEGREWNGNEPEEDEDEDGNLAGFVVGNDTVAAWSSQSSSNP